MPKKSSKTTSKKSSAKVRDLAARKDPKGGAQKREGPQMDGSTRSRTQRGSKPRPS